MTKFQTVWLAGWLEGEGYFGLSKKSGTGIQVVSIDLDVLRKVTRLMGCTEKIKPKKWNKHTKHQAWVCRVGGEKAAEIMRAVLPYMGKRRSTRIREILKYRKGSLARKILAIKANWNNPEIRKRMSEGIAKKARANRHKTSARMKMSWANPKFRRNMMEAMRA